MLAMVAITVSSFTSNVLAGDWSLVAQGEPEAAAATLGIMLLTCVCPLVIGLAVAGGISYFVYTDAVKNRVENPGLWALVCFFTGLIGLLIYFLAIRPKYVK